ncbi:MAG: YraN family protein [Clostridia bacterium]|nr:YraN family protein [Clostridia bacterium]
MYNDETWKMGEQLAQEYMKKHGYKIIYTNFAERGFELDIVAIHSAKQQFKNLKNETKKKLKDEKSPKVKKLLKNNLKNIKSTLKDVLVITEVKSRADDRFGRGCECIDLKKRSHLTRGAKYLKQMERFKNMQVRFDVASVDFGKITYIENSFCPKC